ncbi:TPA: glycosyltransferase family 2 protein, partial [Streptococcus suis]
HEFIVVPDTLDIEQVKSQYVGTGVDLSKIISLKEYRKEIGFIGNLYALLGFVPNMLNRIYLYIQRNGIANTIIKIKSRL